MPFSIHLGYVSPTTVWGKQLTENGDEHLSVIGPGGGNRAAIVATPQKEDCFPKSAFCTHIGCITHLANRKESQTGLDVC